MATEVHVGTCVYASEWREEQPLLAPWALRFQAHVLMLMVVFNLQSHSPLILPFRWYLLGASHVPGTVDIRGIDVVPACMCLPARWEKPVNEQTVTVPVSDTGVIKGT